MRHPGNQVVLLAIQNRCRFFAFLPRSPMNALYGAAIGGQRHSAYTNNLSIELSGPFNGPGVDHLAGACAALCRERPL